jgi:hypothetical protein
MLPENHRRKHEDIGIFIPSARREKSGGFDGDAGSAGGWLGLDDNLYVLPERYEKVHQALDGKAFELVIQEGGDLRLINLKRSRDLSLGEPLPRDNQIEGGSQTGLGVELRRIWQSHVRKDVAAAANDLF